MIEVICNHCNKPLDQPGALMFSPPSKSHTVRKFHLCVKCWKEFENHVGVRTYVLGRDIPY